jgi:hypothetical protein
MSYWTPNTEYPNQFILSTTVGGVHVESGILSGDVLAQAYEMASMGKSFVRINVIEHVYEDCGTEDALYVDDNKEVLERYANSNVETFAVAYVHGRFGDPDISSCLEESFHNLNV